MYINLYDEGDINNLLSELEPGKALLRVVEVPEESDEEWGMLVGYQEGMFDEAIDRDESDEEESGYSLDVSSEKAIGFINSNKKASLEIEKYMSVASDTRFTIIVEQVVSTKCEIREIDGNNYAGMISGTRPGANIPYTIRNADGSVAGSGVTGANGEVKLEAGQYASLEISEGTMWLISERTSASPNYSLKNLQPETDDPRMKKLNENLMLINVPEEIYMTQYRVEWYLADGTLLDSETRVDSVGQIVSVTEEDKLLISGADCVYVFDKDCTKHILETKLTFEGPNVLELYYKKAEVYTVVYSDNKNRKVFETQRKPGYVGVLPPKFESDVSDEEGNPIPVYLGYKFTGWQTNTGDILDVNSVITEDMVDEDGYISYCATWEQTDYIITLRDGNSREMIGTCPIKDSKYILPDYEDIFGVAPDKVGNREGYTWVGWVNKKINETSDVDEKSVYITGEVIELTEDTTLRAVWRDSQGKLKNFN